MLVLGIALLFLLSILSIPTVYACSVIASSGTTTLSGNVISAPNATTPAAGSACIFIGVPNVEFDCAGFSITGNATTGTTYGIYANASATNVTIRNCPSISNYTDGIFLQSLTGGVIANATTFNNSDDGIALFAASGVAIDNVTFYNNTGDAIDINFGNKVNVTNSLFFSGVRAVDFDDSHNTIIANNTVHNHSSAFGPYVARNITISNNTIFNSSVIYDGGFTHGLLFEKTWAYNNTRGIIFGADSGNFTLQHNVFVDNLFNPFIVTNIGGGYNGSIVNNTIINHGGAIRFRKNNSIIANNTITNGLGTIIAIYLEFVENSIIEGNQLNNHTSSHALRIEDNSRNLTIRNNIMSNGTFAGIGTDTADNLNIYGNLIYNYRWGIYVADDTHDSRFWDNTLRDNTEHGIEVENGQHNNTFENNTFDNNNNGLYLQGSENNTVKGNLFYDNTNGLRISAVNLTLFENNTVYNNTNHGFLFDVNSERNNLTENEVYNNSQYGIYMDTAHTFDFINNNLHGNTVGELFDDSGISYLNTFKYFNSYGSVDWTNSSNGSFLKGTNITGNISLTEHLFIGDNIASLNASAFTAPRLINSSANITLYGLSFDSIDSIYVFNEYSTDSSNILSSGTECSECNVISYSGGTLTFSVPSFSSYAARGSTTSSSEVVESSSGGGGTSGGSGASLSSGYSDTSQKRTAYDVEPGDTVTVNFTKEKIPVKEIEFTVSEKQSKVSIWVRTYDELPEGYDLDTLNQPIYRYLRVSSKEEVMNAVKEVEITFEVEKEWVKDNSEVILNKWDGEKWVYYTATVIDETQTHTLYSAQVPELGHFAIGMKEIRVVAESVTEVEPEQHDAITESIVETSDTEEPKEIEEEVIEEEVESEERRFKGLIPTLIVAFLVASAFILKPFSMHVDKTRGKKRVKKSHKRKKRK